ncbi:PTS system mannose-specific IIB component [Raoultella sp. BIGb0138]|uniref:PTS system mannose/fructose/N-acetylgalactosamine-transporter subunit IIB n=1 Tax=Raoultella sp. BIGb0138 TaxID=2485115 RepID=UPI00104EABB8|nr:PTS sugar transporter subunit IIB [Raoultella sp. BIGb0138]TCW17995.1 PTS system mannose-specific IIB component [Raoultella sp. BIGb0138]
MSMISLLRIDDRLIHGQVMTGWVKHLNATKIIIVDDELVNDEFMISVLEMAVPNNMTLNIYDAEAAAMKLSEVSSDNNSDNIIILVKSPLTVLKMLNVGAKFQNLTVGGMGVNENRSRLYRNLAASDAERQAFKDIDKMGIPIQIQVLPGDTPANLMSYL